jgi:hypothetical protein
MQVKWMTCETYHSTSTHVMWCTIYGVLPSRPLYSFMVSCLPQEVHRYIDNNSVGSLTGSNHGLEAGIRFPARDSTPQHPDRFWVSPWLMSKEFRGLVPRGQIGPVVRLITHLPLVPWSRMVEPYLNFPIRFHVVVLNEGHVYLCQGAGIAAG